MKPTPDATLAATRAWSAFVKPNCETSVNMQAPIATRDLFPGKQWEGWWEGEGEEGAFTIHEQQHDLQYSTVVVMQLCRLTLFLVRYFRILFTVAMDTRSFVGGGVTERRRTRQSVHEGRATTAGTAVVRGRAQRKACRNNSIAA